MYFSLEIIHCYGIGIAEPIRAEPRTKSTHKIQNRANRVHERNERISVEYIPTRSHPITDSFRTDSHVMSKS